MYESIEILLSKEYSNTHEELKHIGAEDVDHIKLASVLESLSAIKDLSTAIECKSSICRQLVFKAEWDTRNTLNKLGESDDVKNGGIASERVTVHAHRAGLCNRIRTICAYSVLLGFYEKPKPSVLWIKDDACPAEISDLFDVSSGSLPFEIITACDYAALVSDKATSRVHNLISPWGVWNKFADKSKLTWERFFELYAECVSQVFEQLRSSIKGELSILKNGLPIGNTLAVHLRRGDFVQHYKRQFGKDLADVVDVAVLCLSQANVQTIYLACDEQHASDKFISFVEKRSSIKVITNSHQYKREGVRETSVADSIIDLLMLGGCEGIIGTQGSSFSDMALTLYQHRTRLYSTKFFDSGLNGVVKI